MRPKRAEFRQGLMELPGGQETVRPYEVAGRRVVSLGEVAGSYRTIYCDPPWKYSDEGCGGGLATEYLSMTLDSIAALPVGELAHKDGAHLWLWTTWPMLREGAPQRLLSAWRFRWVGELVWLKGGMGLGRWIRKNTEILILAERGKLKLARNNQVDEVRANREGHSVKPATFRELIEGLSPGPRIELFSRRPAGSWDRWGNQA